MEAVAAHTHLLERRSDGDTKAPPKAPASKAVNPISLDTHYASFWSVNPTPAAVLNPEASTHQHFAWLFSQVKEMYELLGIFIQIPSDEHEMRRLVAEPLCTFTEARLLVVMRALEHLCRQTSEANAQTKPTRETAP